MVGVAMSVIERVKAANGQLVLDFHSRIGARPYVRYKDGEWECISLTYVPEPDYGQHERKVRTAKMTPEITEEDMREWLEPEDPDRKPEACRIIDEEDSVFWKRAQYPHVDELIFEPECGECGHEWREHRDDRADECPECGAEVKS
jgi:predicted Zn-ribbon and HTH transcriptional regulator